MDEFLRVIAEQHLLQDMDFDTDQPDTTEFKKRLEELLSQKLYDEIEGNFLSVKWEIGVYCFVEGMKAAQQILNKEYQFKI